MKYTILGFSQKDAYELGLDVTDLVTLRQFMDFKVVLHEDNDKTIWRLFTFLDGLILRQGPG